MKTKILIGMALAFRLCAQFPAANLQPLPKWQPLDNNGKTIPGGKICFYATGTFNQLPVYTTNTAGVQLPNPIILDSAGRTAPFFGEGSLYRVVLQQPGDNNCPGTGATIWTQDQVGDSAGILSQQLAATSGAGLVGFSQNGMYAGGTVGASLQTVNNYQINALAYGLSSTGTAAANATALTAAIAAACALGGADINLPAGQYSYTTLTLNCSGVSLVGAGTSFVATGGTVLRSTAVSGNDIVIGSSSPQRDNSIRNLSMTGGTGACIYVNPSASNYVSQLTIQNVTATGCGGDGIAINIAYNFLLRDVWATSNGAHGVNLGSATPGPAGAQTNAQQSELDNVFLLSNALDQLAITNGLQIQMNHVTLAGAGSSYCGAALTTASALTFRDSWFDLNLGCQISANSISGLTVVGGSIRQTGTAKGLVVGFDASNDSNLNWWIDVPNWANTSSAARIDDSSHTASTQRIYLWRASGSAPYYFQLSDVTGLSGNSPSPQEFVFAAQNNYSVQDTGPIQMTLSNLQNLNGTPFLVIPAAGSGTMIVPGSCTLELKFGSLAFSGGGTVSIGYGTGSSPATNGTIASTVFTTFAATQAVTVLPIALPVTASTGYLNTGIYMTAASGNFTGGTGATGVLDCSYRILGGF